MDKQHILSEIKRTAEENVGVPLGESRFQQETGIRRTDWYPHYWLRWGDANREAGYKANVLQSAYSDDYVIEKLISLIRELGHYPVGGEIRRRAKNDKGFPTHNGFSRVGKKADLAQKVILYCRARKGMDNIIEICEPIANSQERNPLLCPVEREVHNCNLLCERNIIAELTAEEVGYLFAIEK